MSPIWMGQPSRGAPVASSTYKKPTDVPTSTSSRPSRSRSARVGAAQAGVRAGEVLVGRLACGLPWLHQRAHRVHPAWQRARLTRVRVRPELHAVGGQVQVLRPLDGATDEVEHHHPGGQVPARAGRQGQPRGTSCGAGAAHCHACPSLAAVQVLAQLVAVLLRGMSGGRVCVCGAAMLPRAVS